MVGSSKNQRLRIPSQHRCQGDTFAFSAAEQERRGFAVLSNREQLKRPSHPFLDDFRFETEVFECKRDFFLNGFAEELVVGILEHEADVSGQVRRRWFWWFLHRLF